MSFSLGNSLVAETSIFGYWLTSESIIQIENCGDSLSGRIKHIIVAEGVDPEIILDNKNDNSELQSRPLIGINLLEGFDTRLDSKNALKTRRIYNPKDGRSYKSNLYLLENSNLKVEGCILFFCDGEA